MKNNRLKSTLTRGLACLLAACVAMEPAFGATVTISNTPLATAGGSSVLPNLLFTLDASGSMAWDFLPDYLKNEDNGNNQCMKRSDNDTSCDPGDPAWYAGGQNGSNGVGYDPKVFYKPALNPNNTPLLGEPLTVTAVPVDAFQAQSTSNINVTNAIADAKFCNGTSGSAICKRNGTTGDNTTLASGTDGQGNTQTTGRFPYRTHLSNSSKQMFGLPEMMAMGQFARSGTTVTVTTLAPHNLAVNDRIYVRGSDNNFDATCESTKAVATVTTASPYTFTYPVTGSGTINAKQGSFRKCVSGDFIRNSGSFTGSPSSLTQVTSTAHGMVTGDVIRTVDTTNGQMNLTSVAITRVDDDKFTFDTSSNTAQASHTAYWVRTGLYNVRDTANGPGLAYSITPVEYCTDANLTDCVEVLPGGTIPSDHTVPAYVRFCQTQEQALAPGGIGDASSPRCRGKYLGYGASPSFKFARYGWFTRENIVSGVTFTNRPNRADCVTTGTAPDCTYDEEIQNYARWYTYYRTRMQMMKTASGRAFLPLISTGSANDKLRVGFITINPFYNNSTNSSNQGSVQSSRYLKVDTFRTAHASSWYTKFYQQKPDQGTPLREALSRAGWIYAGLLDTDLTRGIPAADDPVTASCQRHFTLLTTDGYWNGNAGQDITGAPIGTTDSVNPTTDSPYTQVAVDRSTTGTWDGQTVDQTITATPAVTDREVVCQGNLQTTFPGGTNTACGCDPREHRVMHRTTTVTTTVTVPASGATTTSSATDTTIDPAADPNGTCSFGNYTRTSQPKIVTESKICDRYKNSPNPVTFADGGQASCNQCKNGNNATDKRYVLIRQTREYDLINTTTDGVQTETDVQNTTSVRYEWSKNGGSSWSSSAPASSSDCTTDGSSGVQSASVSNNGTAPSPETNSGTTLTLISPNPVGPINGTPIVTFKAATSGFNDTLADVAMYYYRSDLRGGRDTKGNDTGPALNANGDDVSPNNVPARSGSRNYATHQAMVTFSVGLADGLMRYQPNYDGTNVTTGDFYNIKQGTDNGCFWISGPCNWPEPRQDTPTALDDLWHAAVNGRGQYYLATNVDSLATGLQNTLIALGSQVAAASASATSSPNVTQTENQIFSTTYETNTWAGSVFAQTIDTISGDVSSTIAWRAETLLLGRVTATTDTRNLYTFAPSGTDKVKSFDWASLDPTEQGFFSNRCSSNTPVFSQCSTLSSTDQATVNAGQTLVQFLRGQTGNEATLYRDRTFVDPSTGAVTQTILGDTISAKPNYVRAPIFDYGGTYDAFKALPAIVSRAPRVYVGANDGYLHAFDGNTGAEAWAYMPRFLMPKTYALADATYAATHQYFVEGSPEVQDVYDTTASAWKTILVGGAGGGGRGYYALDVTDATAPKALWEWCHDSECALNDQDIGLTYGNPIFGKRAYDGRWVVIFTSGLNNVSPGSGRGYFWVVDAITGQLLNKVSTGVGDTTTPSGLMKQAPFYTNGGKIDATFQYVYAGDQLGNVWRLDVNASPLPATVLNPAPAPLLTKITTLQDDAGRLQPITTRPIPSVVNLSGGASTYVVLVGTGRYLGSPDLTDGGSGTPAWQQSFYAFKDKVYSSAITNNLRTDTLLIERSLTRISPTERGISNSPVATMDWNTKDGWFIDFNPSFGSPAVEDSPGEGVNLVDPRLVNGTIFVATNAPATGAGGAQCSVGGSSFQYNFDFKTGMPVSTSNGVVGWSLGGTITVGVAIVQLPGGAIKAISTGADTSKTTSNVNTAASGTLVKRFSYRVR